MTDSMAHRCYGALRDPMGSDFGSDRGSAASSGAQTEWQSGYVSGSLVRSVADQYRPYPPSTTEMLSEFQQQDRQDFGGNAEPRTSQILPVLQQETMADQTKGHWRFSQPLRATLPRHSASNLTVQIKPREPPLFTGDKG